MRTLAHRVIPLLREMTAQAFAAIADAWDQEAELAVENGLLVRGEYIRAMADQARGTVIEARLGERLKGTHFETMTPQALERLSGRANPMWMKATA